MKKWLKRIRGALGIGLTWAAAWGGVGLILVLVVGAILGDLFVFLGASVVYAATGFIGGAIFSTVLGIAEGRRRFDEMSLWRFAGWGAVGGLTMAVALVGEITLANFVLNGFVYALLGAGCASGSLALARRADDRELLEHGADVADIGLTEEEKHELLTE